MPSCTGCRRSAAAPINDARELAAYVVDLLEGFGPCEARPMFGGQGFFTRV
ncbi:MAG TPA: hypothetical protein VIW27_03760 [Gammaproteobacteria bacterium]|jgi:hypothetical protein